MRRENNEKVWIRTRKKTWENFAPTTFICYVQFIKQILVQEKQRQDSHQEPKRTETLQATQSFISCMGRISFTFQRGMELEGEGRPKECPENQGLEVFTLLWCPLPPRSEHRFKKILDSWEIHLRIGFKIINSAATEWSPFKRMCTTARQIHKGFAMKFGVNFCILLERETIQSLTDYLLIGAA